MKERLAGIGLGVGAVLTLSFVWTGSAQAFSLNSKVNVENFLVVPGTSTKIPYTGSVPIVQRTDGIMVTSDTSKPELKQFGGIWDIDLDDNSISFTLNSLFRDVVSGDDVYRFWAADSGKIRQNLTISIITFTDFTVGKTPVARFTADNELEVIFPQGFAPGGLLPPQPGSKPEFSKGLSIEPDAVPTPALLPGLVGMGLAALRKQHKSHNRV